MLRFPVSSVRNSFVAACVLFAATAVPLALSGAGSDTVDLQMMSRIRQEGFRNSRVMETLSELTDRLGPRLTGSMNHKRANEWTRDQMTSWGLKNAHLESFPFGRGWQLESVNVRMVTPDITPLYAIPKAWTPGTAGAVRGEVVRLKATTKEDLEKERGKFAGKIVLVGDTRLVTPQTEAASRRYDDAKLRELADFQIPGERLQDPTGRVFNREDMMRRMEFQRAVQKFLAEEKVVATIEPSRGEAGLIFVQGTNAYRPGEPDGVPQLVMSIEHFGRISRLIDRKVPVELELDIKAHFEENDGKGYTTIAEIPGSDKADEVVIIGGHIDSWHGGTGATDDAAGVAVAMEAARILQSLGVKPRRTVRVALWGGEEEGLLGSRGYVAEHYGKREERRQPGQSEIPSYMRQQDNSPLLMKQDQKKVSAYFNIDNGTGKLRGIYLQENSAIRPVVEQWMEPFRDLGFTTISMRNTGGTDHLAFDAVGIPGFQFIQDPVEYDTRTHHSTQDVFERVQREDLMQASVVAAAFIYNAAMRDDLLPRKELPKEVVWETPKQDVPVKANSKKADKRAPKSDSQKPNTAALEPKTKG